jgi:glucans biosynthesis protein
MSDLPSSARAACAALFLFVGSAAATLAAVEDIRVDFDYVRGLAIGEAARPYKEPADDLPARLGSLNYDEYRSIRFQPGRALWRRDRVPFQLQFFHRGGLFRDRVTMHEFSGTHEQVIPFLREFFSYDGVKDLPSMHSSLGYAGFRVHTPLNQPGVYDELIAFLGTNYFRAIGAGQLYGLSARGVAIDSGLPGVAEEFPHFTDFWVGKPEPDATSITIYALLKGPSVTGAYEFVVRPGRATTVDIRTALIFRHDVQLPGIAPLTSMFWFGENSVRPRGEMRPEVHDSDGLIVDDDGLRRLWRPLHNPHDTLSTDVPAHKLVRFGLMQRDRKIASYEDLEARYEKRPSVWVEPRGDWEGSVRLVELPTPAESGDNIVAFWRPAAKPVPGKPVEFRYRIVWSLLEPSNAGLAEVASTRQGELPGAGRIFWIDFVDEKNTRRDLSEMVPVIELRGPGRIRRYSIVPYPDINGCRVAIETEGLARGQSISLRCHLRDKTEPVSETWSYMWKP